MGMVIFGGCLAGAALLPTLFPPASPGSARLAAASACLLGAGFGAVLFYSSSMTLIQLAAPDHLRGRMMGIWMIVYSGSVPLGRSGRDEWPSRGGLRSCMGLSAALCVVVGLIGLGVGLSPGRRHCR